MKLSATVDASKVADRIKAIHDTMSSALVPAANAGAEVFVEAAKARVPVLTSYLEEHIQANVAEQTETTVKIDVTPARPAANKWHFDPPYAFMVSFGESKTHKPTPFMHEAWDEAQDAAKQAIIDALTQALHR